MKKCEFFIKRKNRCCKFDATIGAVYCAEHLASVTGDDSKKRIPCPRDPKHSVFEENLAKHLKKCNVAKKEQVEEAQEGFVKNINSPDECEDLSLAKLTMRTAPADEVLALIEKVKNIYKEHKVDIEEEVLHHAALGDELKSPGYGPAVLKHLNQLASLLGHMEKMNFLYGNTSYIEFGAGKGQLSHWVQKALPKEQDVDFLLIDRGCNRHKYDSHHRDSTGQSNFHRLKMDIEHLHLGQVPCIKSNDKPVVGMSKHLCGAATDLCLRCVMNTLQDTNVRMADAGSDAKLTKIPRLDVNKETCKSRLKGLIIALCCHHKCNWHHYCGKEFFRSCGLTARDFHIIKTLGNWAVCGKRKVEEDVNKDNLQEMTVTAPVENQKEVQASYDVFTHEEKEEIGRQCKRLIDIGRMKYAESHGYTVVLKKYVSPELTLENIVMIIVPESKEDS